MAIHVSARPALRAGAANCIGGPYAGDRGAYGSGVGTIPMSDVHVDANDNSASPKSAVRFTITCTSLMHRTATCSR